MRLRLAAAAGGILAIVLGAPASAGAVVPGDCGGADDPAFTDRHVVTGAFGGDVEGAYVMVPFDVPAGTTAVRVRYCYDQPDVDPPGSPIGNTLDLGIYDARSDPADKWDEDEFRGWGGSSHPDVTISPNGFSSEAQYLASPRGYVHGRTTRGFEPGPIPAGRWAVELGVGSVVSPAEGNLDGKVAWRVEVELTDSADFADDTYQPAPYDPAPADPDAGWYEGDMHVHAEHSNLGAATMRETFDYAFAPRSAGGAGLDFLTLSDYVTDTGWGEIGRYQADHPGKLIERSAEVITYRGHANNHGSHTFVDYRTGPIYVRHASGSLSRMRDPRPASRVFDAIHTAGGWTQINHPTIFPSVVPGFSSLCRGCPWDYTPAQTDYSKVDAIEIATGPPGTYQLTEPGPNPFTPTAIQFWESAIDRGGENANHIAAVGSSDSHDAGEFDDLPEGIPSAPVGTARTVVFADELSEDGLHEAVEAGHTYVKLWGGGGPDLRLIATAPGEPKAIMGDTVGAAAAGMTAKVLGLNGARASRPGLYTLVVYRNGLPLVALPMPSGNEFTHRFTATGTARYRLQVQRFVEGVASIEAVSSPIYLAP